MQNWSVNDGCYGRKTNNEEKSKFNDHLEMISLELDGSYPWSRIEVLENALSIDDICFENSNLIVLLYAKLVRKRRLLWKENKQRGKI